MTKSGETPVRRHPLRARAGLSFLFRRGGTDFMARIVGQKLSEALGQQVIVDNRPGAGSTLGFELGVRAAPDGYTFNMITPSWSINPSLYPIKFDAASDYTPILLVARGPFVIVVHPSLPVRNTRQ